MIMRAIENLSIRCLVIFILLSNASHAQYYYTTTLNRSFKVMGTISGSKQPSEIYLLHNGKKYKGKTEGNEFVIKGSFDTPGVVSLQYSYGDGSTTGNDSLSMFLGPGPTKVNLADPVSASQIESFYHKRYQFLAGFFDTASTVLQGLYQRKERFIQEGNRDSVRAADTALVKYSRKIYYGLTLFFLNKGHWILGGYGLKKYMDLYGKHFGENREAENAQAIIRAATNDIFLLPETEDINDYLSLVRMSEKGNTLPNFTIASEEGNKTSLADHKGNYLLLQFLPADGKALPENKKIYNDISNQFQGKALKVFEVTLNSDENPEKWIEQFKKNTSWILRRLVQKLRKFVADSFSDNTLLKNIILDKEGKIIAKNLSPIEIQWKLDELLSN